MATNGVFADFCFPKFLYCFVLDFVVMGSPRYVGFVSPNGDWLCLKMWGVTVPSESQPMKMGGWKVIRYDVHALAESSG
ncbi:hypothetical protein APY94_12350 [Thermococcus celericrescens]|uniref:Uncharacterized protein n=1 Tax=Thermococcus celericrescens TaxID=227598 RepID=A0A117ISP9_9EURY|nr:hypothetical protein APY94_12350 [Thermococcus celericrescens]